MRESIEREGLVPVEGGAIAYAIAGEGPPLVTTHPYAMAATGADKFPGLSTVTVWPRGFGRSSPVRGDPDFGIWRLAGDVEAVRAHLVIGRWAFWGVSMGGFVALVYALTYPERVSALVLDSTAASHHYAHDPASIWPEIGASEEAQRYSRDPTPENTQAFFARMSAIQKARDPSYAPPDDLQVNGRALGRILATLSRYDVRGRLGEIRSPVLVLAGEYDGQCPPSQSRIVAAGIPGARLEYYEGVGHGVVRWGPPEVRESVRAFVAEAAAG